MQSYDIIFIVLCIFTSINCFIIGGVFTYALDYRRNKKKILEKSSEYEKALKISCESNNSLASKIIEIDGKVSDMSIFLNSNRNNSWSK